MSNKSALIYAADRVKDLARQAGMKIPVARVNTAETFALMRKHGVKPETSTQYYARVRAGAQKTKGGWVDPLGTAGPIVYPTLVGNIIPLRDEYYKVLQKRAEERTAKINLIWAYAEDISDALVLGGNRDAAAAIKQINAFIKANT